MTLVYNDLSVAYGDQYVLKDVHLTADPGGTTVIVGISGSGKSTLLRSTLQLLPPAAKIVKGTITYKGKVLNELKQQDLQGIRGSKIGMMFQQPGLYFSPVLRLDHQIKETLKANDYPEMDRHQEILLQSFERIGLEHGERILSSYPFELSGGMIQMMSLMLVSMLAPDFILADEPTSALDVIHQKYVLDELLRLQERQGVGILLVTHNLRIARDYGDKIAIMDEGRIVESGPAEQIMSSPQHPTTQALIRSLEQLEEGRSL